MEENKKEEPEDFHHRCFYHSRLSKYFSAFLSSQSLTSVIQFVRDIDAFKVLSEDDKVKRRELAIQMCRKYFTLSYQPAPELGKSRRRNGTAESQSDERTKEDREREGNGGEYSGSSGTGGENGFSELVGEKILKTMEQRLNEDYLPIWFWAESWDKVYEMLQKEIFPKFQHSTFYSDFLLDSKKFSANELLMEDALSFTPKILDLAIVEARNLQNKDRKDLKAVVVKFHIWGFPKPRLSPDDIHDTLRIEIYAKTTGKIKAASPMWNEFFSIPIPQGGIIPYLYLQVRSTRESLFGNSSDFGNILLPLAERKKFNGWFKLNGDAEIHISVDKRM